MTKTYRSPRPKDGQIKCQYGKLPHDAPDICFVWGDGCRPEDARMLYNLITSKPFHPLDKTFGKSFLENLEERGYDIETLKISVEKKKDD